MANYYYLTNDRQIVGPLSLERLRELSHQGVIRPDTYVAKEGDPQWLAYAEAIPLQRPPLPAVPIPIPPLPDVGSERSPEASVADDALASGASAFSQTAAAAAPPARRSSRWRWVLPVCAGMILVLAVVWVGWWFFGMESIRLSEPYNIAVSHVQNTPQAIELLGGPPVRVGWFIRGSISATEGVETANLSIPVSGQSRSGTVEVRGGKAAGKWSYSRMELLAQEQSLDLRDVVAEKERAR